MSSIKDLTYAVSTLGDVEDPWDVHCEKSPYGCVNRIALANAVEMSGGAPIVARPFDSISQGAPSDLTPALAATRYGRLLRDLGVMPHAMVDSLLEGLVELRHDADVEDDGTLSAS